MKQIISIVLVLVFIFAVLETTAVASNYKTTTTLTSERSAVLKQDLGIISEEKIICDATIDDEFESDSVIVVIKNIDSKQLNEFTEKSFSDIPIISVEKLTMQTEKKIESQRALQKKAVANSRDMGFYDSSSSDEIVIDENIFHQIVKINLEKDSKTEVLRVIKKLEQCDNILMAFPNYIYKGASIPNDELYSGQWALQKTNLIGAWNITTGNSSVKVGVIDSGIDGDHPDLTNRINRSLSKDFTGGNSPLTDEAGHGTQVAGVIGAQGDNYIGVAGACCNISLVSLKAAIKNGDHSIMGYDKLVKAIDYANANNIPILNYSYGKDIYRESVKIALGNYGGLFVCAAGNNAQDITNVSTYPIDYEYSNTIVVAATNRDDVLYTYPPTGEGSNYSSMKVDLAATGDTIYTTSNTGGYCYSSGTSLAAPYVAGVAALLKSKYPELSTQSLKWHITTYVDSIPALNGKVSSGGRLNAYKALNNVIEYTVKYVANGGSGTMADTKVIYSNHTPLRANSFTNSNAGFVGWYGRRGSDNKWCYTNGAYTNWYAEGSQPAGYYKYLYDDEEMVFNSTGVDGDVITLFAQWRIQYNLNFNGNTGTGLMPSIDAEVGVPFILPANTFQKQGYYFDYWYAKNQDGEVFCVGPSSSGWYLIENKPTDLVRKSIYNNGIINENNLNNITHGDNITLYAHWEPVGGMLGDVDMDGTVTVKDASLVQRHVGGLIELTQTQIYIADVDYDGVITVTDASNIQKYSSDLIEYWDN